jgi:hypothetical protein
MGRAVPPPPYAFMNAQGQLYLYVLLWYLATPVTTPQIESRKAMLHTRHSTLGTGLRLTF